MKTRSKITLGQHGTTRAATATRRPGTDNPGRPVPVTGFLGAPSGVVSFATADTTPGARCVLAPAQDHHPEPDAYKAAIRALWRGWLDARQHLLSFARALTPTANRSALDIVGPYRFEAREILEAIAARFHQPTTD